MRVQFPGDLHLGQVGADERPSEYNAPVTHIATVAFVTSKKRELRLCDFLSYAFRRGVQSHSWLKKYITAGLQLK